MSTLVFMDTETTGLSLDDDIWEFAAVRRNEDGTEEELHLFIEHDPAKCSQLPEAFRADHRARFPSTCSGRITGAPIAALTICEFLDNKAHIVGAVPNFDTERIARLIRSETLRQPGWHYHLIDVENLAVGYLAGLARFDGPRVMKMTPGGLPTLPWDSEDLSRRLGVEPDKFDRHTAMGDVRWAMAIYDAITSGEPA